MQRRNRTRPSPDAPPPPSPSTGTTEHGDVDDGTLAAAIRRAGHAHWVAGRATRRWVARGALAGVTAVVLLHLGGSPPAVLSPAAALAAVPLLVWADHASRAWRGRTQHQHELAAIAAAVRAHAGDQAATTLLAGDDVPAAEDLALLRAAAIATIDGAGCRGGHTELCRHRRSDAGPG